MRGGYTENHVLDFIIVLLLLVKSVYRVNRLFIGLNLLRINLALKLSHWICLSFFLRIKPTATSDQIDLFLNVEGSLQMAYNRSSHTDVRPSSPGVTNTMHTVATKDHMSSPQALD